MYIYTQNTHGILLQNIGIGLGLSWDDFKKQNSRRDLDPPTHFHGFSRIFLLYKVPYATTHNRSHVTYLMRTGMRPSRCSPPNMTYLMRTGMSPSRCSPRMAELSSAILNMTSSFLKLLSSNRRTKLSLQPNVSIGNQHSLDISSLRLLYRQKEYPGI